MRVRIKPKGKKFKRHKHKYPVFWQLPLKRYVLNPPKIHQKSGYYPDPDAIKDEVKEDAIFWYPPGYRLSERETIKDWEVMGIYLQGRIDPKIQKDAYNCLQQLNWRPAGPRTETKAALERQKGLDDPKELTIGFTGFGTINITDDLIANKDRIRGLESILHEMTAIFARTLPKQFSFLNVPLTKKECEAEWQRVQGVKPEFRGIPTAVRLMLTPFSTLTLLKSCPTAIHKDSYNARIDQGSYSCLTSLRGERSTGGEFCLISHALRVPVKPGDILIAQTHREFHTNLTRVRGTKYSIVGYFHKAIPNPKKKWVGIVDSRTDTEDKERAPRTKP